MSFNDLIVEMRRNRFRWDPDRRVFVPMTPQECAEDDDPAPETER